MSNEMTVAPCKRCGMYGTVVGMYFLENLVYCAVCRPPKAKRIIKCESAPDEMEECDLQDTWA